MRHQHEKTKRNKEERHCKPRQIEKQQKQKNTQRMK